MIRRLGAAIAVAALATACTSAPGSEVVVAVASSMGPALRDVAAAFEADHPETKVTLTIGGSTQLRDQVLLAAAPVDILVLADVSLLITVDEAGLVTGAVHPIATNRLVLGVPDGNPGGVAALGDLADPELAVGLCAVGVPCGDLARTALVAAGIAPAVDTYEPNVGSLVAKLDAGELDVGLVYVTDIVAPGGSVVEVPLSDTLPTTTYGAALTTTGDAPQAASELVEFLRSGRGADILAEYGFGRP